MREFAESFPSRKVFKQGETVALEEKGVYIVARGELQFHTTLPVHGKMETKGYRCKKYPGDIVSKTQAQHQTERKVRGPFLPNGLSSNHFRLCYFY